MTTRADLIETAARALCEYEAGPWPDCDGAHFHRTDATIVLDAVLPQITTAEQLEALPTLTVVIDCDGDPWRRNASGDWESPSDDGPTDSPFLTTYGPLTVVWQPQPEQESDHA